MIFYQPGYTVDKGFRTFPVLQERSGHFSPFLIMAVISKPSLVNAPDTRHSFAYVMKKSRPAVDE